MGTIIGSSVQWNAVGNIEKGLTDADDYCDDIRKGRIIKLYADRMMKSGIISKKEYSSIIENTIAKIGL